MNEYKYRLTEDDVERLIQNRFDDVATKLDEKGTDGDKDLPIIANALAQTERLYPQLVGLETLKF